MLMKKYPTSFRLPPKVKQLIKIIAEKLEISQTTVIVVAIREYAKKENINVDRNTD